MTDKPKKLSDTARALLTVAATRCDHLIRPPRLPIAAARQVVRSLLNAGLAEEVPAPIDDAGYGWRTGKDGGVLVLRATALGLAQLGDGEAGTPTPAPIAPETCGTTLAAFGSQGAQDGQDANPAATPHGAAVPAAGEPPGPSQHPPQRQYGRHDTAASDRPLRRCSRHGTSSPSPTPKSPAR